MITYMILIMCVKVVGDYFYEDEFDIFWYRYFIFLILIVGGMYVFGN